MRAPARRAGSARGPLAQDFLGVLAARRSPARRQIARRHQGGIRTWELAGEELGEERMVAQLGWLQDRLAATVRRAEEEIPLLAGARREQRVGFGDQRAIESLNRPCAPPDGFAEALPELRLQ